MLRVASDRLRPVMAPPFDQGRNSAEDMTDGPGPIRLGAAAILTVREVARSVHA